MWYNSLMENNPIRDMVTEEVSKWSTWEAAKFIGLATVLAPGLVLEAGKDYIINKVHGKSEGSRDNL